MALSEWVWIAKVLAVALWGCSVSGMMYFLLANECVKPSWQILRSTYSIETKMCCKNMQTWKGFVCRFTGFKRHRACTVLTINWPVWVFLEFEFWSILFYFGHVSMRGCPARSARLSKQWWDLLVGQRFPVKVSLGLCFILFIFAVASKISEKAEEHLKEVREAHHNVKHSYDCNPLCKYPLSKVLALNTVLSWYLFTCMCVRDESSECMNPVGLEGKSCSGVQRILSCAERRRHWCHQLVIIHRQHSDRHKRSSDSCTSSLYLTGFRSIYLSRVFDLRLFDGLWHVYFWDQTRS